MLGGLAQYLLLSGHNCLYDDSFEDDRLQEIVQTQDRILLSRDRKLIEQTARSLSYFVDFTDPREQLCDVVEEFDLQITRNTIFTRCTTCNTLTEPVSTQKVKDQIPEQTQKWIDEYRRCPDCAQIYWLGTHYQAIVDKFTRWNLL